LSGLRTGTVSMVNIYRQLARSGSGEVLLLDIGEGMTSAAILQEKRLRYVRNIYWGIDAIRDQVRSSTTTGDGTGGSITGLHEWTVDPEDEFYQAILRNTSAEGLKSIRETIAYYTATIGGRAPESVFMYGGGSLVPGLNTHFENELQIPVKRLSEHLAGPFLNVVGRADLGVYLPAIGVGFSLLKGQKNQDIELLQGEFQPVIGMTMYRRPMVKGAVLLVFLVSLYIYFLHANIGLREKRVAQLETMMQEILSRNIPDANPGIAPDLQMKSYLQEQKSRYSGSRLVNWNQSALHILRLIHQKIPQDINVMIKELQIDRNRVDIQGETGGLDSIIIIKKVLETIPLFGVIDLSSEQKQGAKGVLNFRLKIPVTSRETEREN